MSAKVRTLLLRLHGDRRGLTTVEYAIVLCLIAAVVVTTWQKFGADVKTKLVKGTGLISSELDTGLNNSR